MLREFLVTNGSYIKMARLIIKLVTKWQTVFNLIRLLLLFNEQYDLGLLCLKGHLFLNVQNKYVSLITLVLYQDLWEHNGSVVESLTQHRRAAGLSLTGVTALCP